MLWYQNLILSFMEIASALILWSGLNAKVKNGVYKNIIITFVLVSVTGILDYFSINTIDFLFNYILLLLCIVWFNNISIRVAVFELFFVIVSSVVIQLLSTCILFIKEHAIEYTFNNGLLVNLLMIIISIFLSKTSLLRNVTQMYLKYSRLILTILFNLLIGVVVILGVWRIDKDFVWDYIAIIVIGIFLWGIINVYFLYQTIKIDQQRKVIATHEQYIPYLRGLVDEVRLRQHDYNNHFNVLYGLVEIDDDHVAKSELKNYLEGLVSRSRPVDHLLSLKDNILAAIIYSKKNVAEEKGVHFMFQIKGEVPEYPIKKYELVEILGNLLDNALEAMEPLEDKGKEIRLTIGKEKDTFYVQVDNTRDIHSLTNLDKVFEKGYSTKKGKNRGYGLYNVKKIIQSYGGTIEVTFDERYTSFKLMF